MRPRTVWKSWPKFDSDLNRLANIGHTYFGNLFTRHVTQRLRRDPIAANIVREFVMDPELSDSRAAQLASLLAESVGLDDALLNEVERRVLAQREASLAPVVRDHATSATVSVRTIFTRVGGREFGYEVELTAHFAHECKVRIWLMHWDEHCKSAFEDD